MRLTPSEIAAMAKAGPGAGTSGVAGIQSTVLSGDPTKPGPYTIEIRVPPHVTIAAHAHRDERSAVVVSGEWYLGYGATATEAAVKLLPPGSFYTEPAGERALRDGPGTSRQSSIFPALVQPARHTSIRPTRPRRDRPRARG